MLKKANWPHKTTIRTPGNDEAIETWLQHWVGEFRQDWNVVYYHDHTDYYFRNGEHMTHFILKWH